MKILILESDLDLKQKITNFLIDNHFDIITANNGLQAIEIINSSIESGSDDQKIDLVICDIEHENKINSNHIRFINHIQKDNIKIPFIFIADHNNSYKFINSTTINKSKNHWKYLVKPILNIDAILVLIEHLAHHEHLSIARNLYYEHIEFSKTKLIDEFQELEQDHISGFKLQQQLLPENNLNLLSLNFKYFLHPSLYISGDFIGYQQLNERFILFYLSDVSGHGVGCAFVTVLVKACIQQYASEFEHLNNDSIINPEKMLSILNTAVCNEKLGKYLTMSYMIYDNLENKLIYSVAGHYPFPILINSKAEFIGDRGYPVGMFNAATYVNHYLNLPDKFKLAIFSDGIMDIRTEDNLDEKEQSILDILLNHHDQDLEVLMHELAIDPNAGLPDDITGLIVAKH